MMSITHCALSVTTVCISLGTANPWVLLCGAVGSQLPDLDTTSSTFGRILYPIAHEIEKRWAHRTITHSFLSTGIVAILAAPLALWDWRYWVAMVLGQFVGWFADCFTKSGAAAFFPNPVRLVIPGNPKVRLSTHSANEYWILAIVCFVLIVCLNLIGSGGITEQFAIAFFQDAGTAADQFHKHGAGRIVTVDVEGQHLATGRYIKDSYTVIEANANDLIGESSTTGKLHKIGNSPDVQVRPIKVKVRLGVTIAVKARAQTLKEIAVSDWVKRLPPGSYVSGSLLLDDMNQLRLQNDLEEYPSVRVFGGQVELSNARPETIDSRLRDFWIVKGQTIVKARG